MSLMIGLQVVVSGVAVLASATASVLSVSVVRCNLAFILHLFHNGVCQSSGRTHHTCSKTMMRSKTVLMRARQGACQEARFEFTHKWRTLRSAISLKSFNGTLLWVICQIPLAFGVIVPTVEMSSVGSTRARVKSS